MTRSQTDISQGENELLFSKRAEKKAPKFLKPQGHFLKDFPVSDILDISMTEEKIRKYAYTKEEVDRMIDHAVRVAVAEAQRIDEESMKLNELRRSFLTKILSVN